jgi:hypothetical protein
MENRELTDIIVTNFNLTDFKGELDSESEYLNALQKALSARIVFFIRSDLDRLLQILYRIDIPQEYSDKAFELGEIKIVSMELAKLIIKRQLQKIDYAKKFNKDNNS